MLPVRAPDSIAPKSDTSAASNTTDSQATAKTVDTAPPLASNATMRVIDGGKQNQFAVSGLATPGSAQPAVIRVAAATPAAPQAQSDGSVQASAVRIQQMSTAFRWKFGAVFGISKADNQEIAGIFMNTKEADQPKLIEKLATYGLLSDLIRKTTRINSQMIRNHVLTNLGGVSDPAFIIGAMGNMSVTSAAELTALPQMLRDQLGDPKADKVLQQLAAQNAFSKVMPWMVPTFVDCSSPTAAIDLVARAAAVELERKQNLARLESMLSSFPPAPNNGAANLLRSQFESSYNRTRAGEAGAAAQCALQSLQNSSLQKK